MAKVTEILLKSTLKRQKTVTNIHSEHLITNNKTICDDSYKNTNTQHKKGPW